MDRNSTEYLAERLHGIANKLQAERVVYVVTTFGGYEGHSMPYGVYEDVVEARNTARNIAADDDCSGMVYKMVIGEGYWKAENMLHHYDGEDLKRD